MCNRFAYQACCHRSPNVLVLRAMAPKVVDETPPVAGEAAPPTATKKLGKFAMKKAKGQKVKKAMKTAKIAMKIVKSKVEYDQPIIDLEGHEEADGEDEDLSLSQRCRRAGQRSRIC